MRDTPAPGDKGGETSDKPSDWRPIGLLNVGTQLIHHVVNYRLTTITEVENLIVPGQDGGRAGRDVDLNQLKLDFLRSAALGPGDHHERSETVKTEDDTN